MTDRWQVGWRLHCSGAGQKRLRAPVGHVYNPGVKCYYIVIMLITDIISCHGEGRQLPRHIQLCITG